MKQLYLFLRLAFVCLVALPIQLSAQLAHQYTFVKTLPGKPVSMVVDPQRNTYVSFADNTIVQYNAQGTVRWQQTFAIGCPPLIGWQPMASVA